MKTYLGIHVGHNASAALMVNGKIVHALQEERFTNQKNFMGFPEKSLRYLAEYVNTKSLIIDEASFSTIKMGVFEFKYQINHYFSVKDFHEYYGEKFYNKKIKGQSVQSYINNLDKNNRLKKNIYSKIKSKNLFSNPLDYQEISKNYLKKIFKKKIKLISFLDHHTCHAYYGKYSIDNKENNYAVIVLDSIGDNVNQSIWLSDTKKGELKSILRNNQCELGRIYKLVTLIMNMKPDEHEFKVMGMAPYAKEYYFKKIYKDVFQNIQKFKGLAIVHKKRPKNLYIFLKEKLKHHRFDNIAGAVQHFIENIIGELLTKIFKKHQIKTFYFSGGISMNVKMYNTFIKNKHITKIHNAPSGADESLSIGACYYLNRKSNSYPLDNLSLGLPVSETNQSLLKIIKKQLAKNYKVKHNVKPKEIAKLLSKNKIIAIADGREEFGARALGNRSIIANPSDPENVKQINQYIKNRDFWMPFALTIIDNKVKKYIDNPKNLSSEFMNLSFDTKKKYFKNISAGAHPYDKTVRPQFLKRKQNENFYEIIKEFSKLTNIDAVLNTSLNLHGNPKCSSIDTVIKTFKSSGLKYLYINGSILVKKLYS